jgi:hypothetical protein
MNSKKLHKHALPIVMIAVAGFVGLTGLAVSLSGGRSLSVADSLTTNAVSITRTHNGLADVQLRTSKRDSTSDNQVSQSLDMSHVAKSVAYQLALQPSN